MQIPFSIVSLFLVFCLIFFIGAIGAAVLRFSKTKLYQYFSCESIGIGLILLVTYIQVIGAFLLLRNIFAWMPLIAFSCFGVAPFGLEIFRAIQSVRLRKDVLAIVLFLMSAQFLLFQTLNAVVPNAHGDPLSYHLSSARIWAEHGGIFFIPYLPWAFQGGTAEYLFLVFRLLSDNLMLMLVSSQILHVLFGLVGSSILIFQMTRRFATLYWSLLAVLCFVAFPYESHMLIRAKNDGFMLFLLLLSLKNFLPYFESFDASKIGLGLFFAAGAIAMKHTALFAVLPVFLVLLCIALSERRFLFSGFAVVCAVICALFACQTWFRNFYWTGNPFFPAFQELFGETTLLHAYNISEIKKYSYISAPVWEMFSQQLRWYFFAKPVCIFALISFVFWNLLSRFGRVLSVLIPMILLTLIIVTGKGYSVRFGFVLYALSALQIAMVCQICYQRTARRNIFLACLFILTAMNIGLEQAAGRFFKTSFPYLMSDISPKDYLFKQVPFLAIVEHANHFGSGAIFSMYHNENFFSKTPIYNPENTREAAEILTTQNFEQAIAEMRHDNVKFFVIEKPIRSDLKFLIDHPGFSQNFTKQFEIEGLELFSLN